MIALDSRIGVLNSGLFYVFANGYDQPEVRGTREEVEVALGLRSAAPKFLAAQVKKPATKKAKIVYIYEVEITPKYEYCVGSWKSGVYHVEVPACTAKDAIKHARQDRLNEEGRFEAPATYRAKRI